MIVLHQRTCPIPRLTLPCHNKSSLHHMPHSPPLGGCLMEDAPLIQPGKQLWKPSSYNVTCKSWACRAACLAGTDSLTPGGPDGSSKPSETWAKVTFPTTIWLSWPKFPSSWCPSLENTTIIHNLWQLLNGKTTPKSLAPHLQTNVTNPSLAQASTSWGAVPRRCHEPRGPVRTKTCWVWGSSEMSNRTMIQWIGLRENLNRKPMGFYHQI